MTTDKILIIKNDKSTSCAVANIKKVVCKQNRTKNAEYNTDKVFIAITVCFWILNILAEHSKR